MSKSLYISEKPSVAQEFAKALKSSFQKRDGYLEAENAVVTWCVGHLVTMSYPEVYDPALKRWTLETLPFLPQEYRYEIIPAVAKQFQIVKGLLNRADIDRIYVCTDSGREGEYIYRLVDQMAEVPKEKERRRVWIDSQTEEEILKGIQNAKPLSAYDNLADAAYLRAKEDYLMGINFSRVLTLKYGQSVKSFLHSDRNAVISVGRVMTCVLGMAVRREREIRAFVKTPFYRVTAGFSVNEGKNFEGEFRAVEGSGYFNSPLLYKENGFRELVNAEKLIEELLGAEALFEKKVENNKNIEIAKAPEEPPLLAEIAAMERKKENKNPPLLYNLAELQNDCSRILKISPDETLKIVQELYEKKLVTYPRTDARVLSTAVAKEIDRNIKGLFQYKLADYAKEAYASNTWKQIAKTRYVNDKQITDHYAIIPTGQGFGALPSLNATAAKVYELIVRRFLSIFYPPAVYQKLSITMKIGTESFFASFKVLIEEGYLKVAGQAGAEPEKAAPKKKGANTGDAEQANEEGAGSEGQAQEVSSASYGIDFFESVKHLKKGMKLPVKSFTIREGETAPPKRYNSGSMILAMENAGQLIEDEELRAQIKGSGIGTSATRAEILNKLVKISYLDLNKKTQIITPTLTGEMVYDVVNASIRSLLNPELTASWEKGLTYVAEGTIRPEEYMEKLNGFVMRLTNGVKGLNNQIPLRRCFEEAAKNYNGKGTIKEKDIKEKDI
ncbi:MAG: type IA DNA topoisomerase [Lachnospiraceae bacterium]|nr:type IA DNA topoisomerase [Lachnospiraceae bacterium]